MTDLEALNAEREWLDFVLWGTPEQIGDLLARLDETAISAGWTRNQEAERTFAGGRSSLHETRCYQPPGSPARLWVYLLSPHRVIGGSVHPRDPNRYTQEVGELVQEFRSNILRPAVAASGVTEVENRLGPRSRVPGSVMEALLAVVEAEPRCWDHPSGTKLWRNFVVSAYLNALFDPDELKSLLVRLGWQGGDASELFDRLMSDASLLAEYEDRRLPA